MKSSIPKMSPSVGLPLRNLLFWQKAVVSRQKQWQVHIHHQCDRLGTVHISHQCHRLGTFPLRATLTQDRQPVPRPQQNHQRVPHVPPS